VKNKLTFISCARSDFGLISNLYDSFVKEKIFNCSLVCTGTVQSNNYGYSKSDLLKLNQNIILIPNKGISPGYKNILKNIYNNNLKLIEYLKEFQPRLVFILGDRIEAIHLGILVRMMNFPIAHLHGGESTTGVYDDYWRHALSKISSLHFVANSTYKKNLIKMGEKANKIHVVGAYGLENIRRIKKTFINKEYFKNKYKFTFNQNNFVVVFHSNTLNQNSNYRDFKIIFDTNI
jgi:GDP/UDP-N,N'-diacetylbacillosamine 2-epimerase (hydrolysing)